MLTLLDLLRAREESCKAKDLVQRLQVKKLFRLMLQISKKKECQTIQSGVAII